MAPPTDFAIGLGWFILAVAAAGTAAGFVQLAKVMLAARRYRRKRAQQWEAWRPKR